jgi:cation diffusion facilitator family transporter
VTLVALHAVTAFASGSLAVAAELVHNFVDLASAVVVVVGLKFAMRKSGQFPYGLYKVENLVAAGVAILIFITAYEIINSVLFSVAPPPRVDLWMLLLLILTMTIPLVFSHFELRTARATNSPALTANAREYRVHAYTTGLAFASLLTAPMKIPLDRISALIIVIAVAKTGWDLLVDSLRVLLDASLDINTLGEVRQLIENDSAVAEVKWITGRNAGRFRFVEAGVALRLVDLAKVEVVLRRIESSVRTSMPRIERVLLHVEARASNHDRYAIPVTDLSGTIGRHFGEAEYFAFVTVDRIKGVVEEQHMSPNPYRKEPRGKGIRTAEWLAKAKVDRVFVLESLDGKGPGYVLRDAGVDVQRTTKSTVTALMEDSFAQSRPEA